MSCRYRHRVLMDEGGARPPYRFGPVWLRSALGRHLQYRQGLQRDWHRTKLWRHDVAQRILWLKRQVGVSNKFGANRDSWQAGSELGFGRLVNRCGRSALVLFLWGCSQYSRERVNECEVSIDSCDAGGSRFLFRCAFITHCLDLSPQWDTAEQVGGIKSKVWLVISTAAIVIG